jgi:hypothetical protein
MPSAHLPPCNDIIVLKEKIAAHEAWRANTETDLKDIREVIRQARLLMSLSIGGGGLSVLTLIISLILLVTGNK